MNRKKYFILISLSLLGSSCNLVTNRSFIKSCESGIYKVFWPNLGIGSRNFDSFYNMSKSVRRENEYIKLIYRIRGSGAIYGYVCRQYNGKTYFSEDYTTWFRYPDLSSEIGWRSVKEEGF